MNDKIVSDSQLIFYQKVMDYIKYEYDVKYCKMPKQKNNDFRIFGLICQYHHDRYSVPFVAGQIVDLLKSKYEN